MSEETKQIETAETKTSEALLSDDALEQLSGGGTLTKLGGGTLILASSNTYTGLTTVEQGTLTSRDGQVEGNEAEV